MCTASSFAALITQAAVPPVRAASMASLRQGVFSRSGAKKLSSPRV